MGLQLSWESTCFARKGSAVRTRLVPPYKDKQHKYYPDFELADGTLVETKGYHSDIVDAKTASVKDRSIIVLYEKDLSYAFDWVKAHYQFNDISDLYE